MQFSSGGRKTGRVGCELKGMLTRVDGSKGAMDETACLDFPFNVAPLNGLVAQERVQAQLLCVLRDREPAKS